MANAKKLTEPQIAALRAIARGDSFPVRTVGQRSTRDALIRRGLVVYGVDPEQKAGSGGPVYRYQIAPAGRHALFEATGENTAPPAESAEPAPKASINAVLDRAEKDVEVTFDGRGVKCPTCGVAVGSPCVAWDYKRNKMVMPPGVIPAHEDRYQKAQRKAKREAHTKREG